jgi:hypothetical protein
MRLTVEAVAGMVPMGCQVGVVEVKWEVVEVGRGRVVVEMGTVQVREREREVGMVVVEVEKVGA